MKLHFEASPLKMSKWMTTWYSLKTPLIKTQEVHNNRQYSTYNMPITTTKTQSTVLLCTAVVFLFADQNLIAPNMSAIAQEFNFTEHQKDQYLGANIALGFFLVGGAASLAAGYLADTSHRIQLFAAVVICGECACLGTYFTHSYSELLISRVFAGVGVGGAAPVIFSLFADMYPNTARTYMSTLVGASMGAGISLGQLAAGMIGPQYGWRMPFLLAALPALANALLILLLVPEPVRGAQERALLLVTEPRSDQSSGTDNPTGVKKKSQVSPLTSAKPSRQCRAEAESGGDMEAAAPARARYREVISWPKVQRLLRTPTVCLVYLQGVPGCVPWGMIYVFLNDYLSHNHHMSVKAATVCMTVFGLGSLVGQLLGGWAGQMLYNSGQRAGQCYFMGGACMVGALPVIYVLQHGPAAGAGTSLAGYYALLFLTGLAVSIPGPNVRAILQNVCPPETRGTAFAVFNLTDDIGKGGGPALVAAMVHGMGGRENAFVASASLWVLCGALQCLMGATVAADEEAVNYLVMQSVYRSQPTTSPMHQHNYVPIVTPPESPVPAAQRQHTRTASDTSIPLIIQNEENGASGGRTAEI